MPLPDSPAPLGNEHLDLNKGPRRNKKARLGRAWDNLRNSPLQPHPTLAALGSRRKRHKQNLHTSPEQRIPPISGQCDEEKRPQKRATARLMDLDNVIRGYFFPEPDITMTNAPSAEKSVALDSTPYHTQDRRDTKQMSMDKGHLGLVNPPTSVHSKRKLSELSMDILSFSSFLHRRRTSTRMSADSHVLRSRENTRYMSVDSIQRPPLPQDGPAERNVTEIVSSSPPIFTSHGDGNAKFGCGHSIGQSSQTNNLVAPSRTPVSSQVLTPGEGLRVLPMPPAAQRPPNRLTRRRESSTEQTISRKRQCVRQRSSLPTSFGQGDSSGRLGSTRPPPPAEKVVLGEVLDEEIRPARQLRYYRNVKDWFKPPADGKRRGRVSQLVPYSLESWRTRRKAHPGPEDHTKPPPHQSPYLPSSQQSDNDELQFAIPDALHALRPNSNDSRPNEQDVHPSGWLGSPSLLCASPTLEPVSDELLDISDQPMLDSNRKVGGGVERRVDEDYDEGTAEDLLCQQFTQKTAIKPPVRRVAGDDGQRQHSVELVAGNHDARRHPVKLKPGHLGNSDVFGLNALAKALPTITNKLLRRE
ncbi:hypothetical protein BV22DRAFT_1125782 [Leucogyrophana mollusca]|uniref:Uncharacterized protein n=1 Tax=Leucogyrophana mollusca TaxID=85980 RepID=A0ACB8BW04_9AGAM|nr:hypothetical protein BV22DRAFT_1125782 [Leucogyrophana mollusca]